MNEDSVQAFKIDSFKVLPNGLQIIESDESFIDFELNKSEKKSLALKIKKGKYCVIRKLDNGDSTIEIISEKDFKDNFKPIFTLKR